MFFSIDREKLPVNILSIIMKEKLLFFIFLLIKSSKNAPKSRKSILQEADGPVMPPGELVNIVNFNYDFLVHDCLGTDNIAGIFIIILNIYEV